MNIAVYCGSASGNRPSFTEGAKALGSWIAQNGHTLVYGGSRTGLMGADGGRGFGRRRQGHRRDS